MVVLTRFRFVVSFVLSLITSLGPAQPPPHQCRTFPLLPVQMGYGLLCGLCGAEQNVNHVVLHCPIYRPPHGLHGLTVLDDETTKWLLNTFPDI